MRPEGARPASPGLPAPSFEDLHQIGDGISCLAVDERKHTRRTSELITSQRYPLHFKITVPRNPDKALIVIANITL
jgi:hypothetical protein